MNAWTRVLIDGVECVEHDGYAIGLEDLRARPTFFIRHVSEKSWMTPSLTADLARWARHE